MGRLGLGGGGEFCSPFLNSGHRSRETSSSYSDPTGDSGGHFNTVVPNGDARAYDWAVKVFFLTQMK